jgi:glutamyl-tRNA synthetase
VIRGDDHVNNTPRQINILRALGATPPVYAHLPTVLTPEGDKLSKRHGARGVLQYRDDGYLPEAVVNYLARLGWSHGDAEVFSRDEFVDWFDLAGLTPSPGRLDPEKLRWLNQEHLKRLAPDVLARRLRPFLERAGLDLAGGPDPADVAVLLRERVSTLAEMAEAARYFYALPDASTEQVAPAVPAESRPALEALQSTLATVDWTREAIGAALKATAKDHGLKAGQVMMPVRLLVTGTAHTPAIDAVLALVGRERVAERLARGLGSDAPPSSA